MLTTKLLHPDILASLGRAGHGSQVLIADGNYPTATASPSTAAKVFLNLMPGVVSVTDVLTALLSAVPIESATSMMPADASSPPIHHVFYAMLPAGIELKRMRRLEFYEAVQSPSTALVIATGDQRRFANLLLTIGAVKHEDP